MAAVASLSGIAAAAPAAFAKGSHLQARTTRPQLGSSFTGTQLAPVLANKKLAAHKQSTSVSAFLVGPGCGPRYGRGFYGRGPFQQGPVVVVPVPGTGAWPGYYPPDPEQFEEYQKRQKEAYEQRRAAFEARRAAWEVESKKRRDLREKQREFFRKQQEELCREQQKWQEEYRERSDSQQTASTATQEAQTAPPKQEEEQQQPEVPPKYPQSDTPVVHLRNEANGAEISLIGTAHISEASVEEVRNLIRAEQPDAVFVELDRKRYNRLVAASPEQQFLEEMMRMFTGAGVGPVGRLIGVGLMGFYRLLAYRGLSPGREFKAAIEEAKRLGAKVVLGDQDIDETLRNLEASMSPRDIQAFFSQSMPEDVLKDMARDGPRGMGPGSFGPFGPLMSGRETQAWVEKLKDRKVVRKLNAYMKKNAPALEKVMLQQRNEKMTRALRHLEGKVVAVVGMSHLDGIEQLWQEANEKARSQRQAEVVDAEVEAPAADVVETAQDADVQLKMDDADVVDGVADGGEEQSAASSSDTATAGADAAAADAQNAESSTESKASADDQKAESSTEASADGQEAASPTEEGSASTSSSEGAADSPKKDKEDKEGSNGEDSDQWDILA